MRDERPRAQRFEQIRAVLAGSPLRKNVVAGIATTVGNLLLFAVSYPLYLHFLGYEQYGVWLALSTVAAFAQLGNLGIGQAITKYVAEEYARDERSKVEAYSATAIALLSAIGLVVVTVAVALRGPVVSLFKLPSGPRELMLELYNWSALLSAYVIVTQVHVGVLGGLGQIGRATYIQLFGRAFSLVTSAVGLAVGQGPRALIIGSFVGYGLVHLWAVLAIRRSFSIRTFVPNKIEKGAAQRLLGFGAGMLGATLLNLALHPLNRLIVSRYSGVASLPTFEIAYSGAMQVRTFLDGALRPLMPEFSRLAAVARTDTKAKIAALDRKAATLTWMLGAPGYALCFALTPIVLHLWLGPRYLPVQAPVFRIMLVGSFISALALPGYNLLLGAGRVRAIVGCHAVQTAVNLMLQLTGSWTMGVLPLWWATSSVTVGFVASTLYVQYQRGRLLADA